MKPRGSRNLQPESSCFRVSLFVSDICTKQESSCYKKIKSCKKFRANSVAHKTFLERLIFFAYRKRFLRSGADIIAGGDISARPRAVPRSCAPRLSFTIIGVHPPPLLRVGTFLFFKFPLSVSPRRKILSPIKNIITYQQFYFKSYLSSQPNPAVIHASNPANSELKKNHVKKMLSLSNPNIPFFPETPKSEPRLPKGNKNQPRLCC